MINKQTVLIGSDFEHFLKDVKTGEFVSAIPFNRGTKADPEKLDKDGCCIQRDGVLQECNVPPVKLDEAEVFWDNVEYVREYLTKLLKPKGLKLECCASGTLPKEEMKSKEARMLGCDPDYNAWRGGEMNEKAKLRNKYFRTCGCHFHMSYAGANPDTSLELVKLFDLYVTVPFILIDKDKQRRLLYGQAGSFRLQDWGTAQGVEFRQLSNKVLESQELVEYVFNQLDLMIDHYNQRGAGSIDDSAVDIVNCINNSNEELAKKLMIQYEIPMLLEKLEENEANVALV